MLDSDTWANSFQFIHDENHLLGILLRVVLSNNLVMVMKKSVQKILLLLCLIIVNYSFSQLSDKQKELAVKYKRDIERAEKFNQSGDFKESNLLIDSIRTYTGTTTLDMWALQMFNCVELVEEKKILEIYDWRKSRFDFENKINKEKYQKFLVGYESKLADAILVSKKEYLIIVYLQFYENGVKKNEIKNFIDLNISPRVPKYYSESKEWTIKLIDLYNLRFPDSWSKLSIPNTVISNSENKQDVKSNQQAANTFPSDFSIVDYRNYKSFMGIPFLSISFNSFMPFGIGLVETYTNKGIGFYSFLKFKPTFQLGTEGVDLLSTGAYKDPETNTVISPNKFISREIRSGLYGGVGLTAHVFNRFYGYFGIGYGFNKTKTIIDETKFHFNQSVSSARGLVFDLGTTIYCNSAFSLKLGMTRYRTVKESFLSTGIMFNL